MKKELKCYLQNGKLKVVYDLTLENIGSCHGQLVKCYLNDETIKIGYMDAFRMANNDKDYDGDIHDFIYLTKWKNLNEETHQLVGDTDEEKYAKTFEKVNIDKIIKIDAILYSAPKWGGRLTNLFFIEYKANYINDIKDNSL